MNKEGICCLCGKKYVNYGNDPRPIVSNYGDRCCDECNENIVIPTRLKLENKEEEKINFWDIKASIHEKNKESSNCIKDFLN